ncbi:putative cytochrome P450 alkane hydroxylase [Talaromyces proteolyticus]|uniref:Cytochrome P450 alkane hydroxylase n=1 Tax=Talaromyces proteolyticus TaxID=1131652 RepID=A0AAD4KX21_9EURO|nr:putative cytochrome P450 alkane hydroxylase [Talaromyces proteolyticus]KAH8701058.1 putative cytochrome P450 alkane hydroxylase [Talaromyces proteolyticus]
MAIPYSHLAAGLFVTWVLYSLLRSVFTKIQTRRKARALGCLPAKDISKPFFGIGTYLELAKAAKEKRALEAARESFAVGGHTFQRTILGLKALNTLEPENIKAILATQFSDFDLGARHRLFFPLLGNGIFTLDGAGWSHSRAMLRPQFAREQVADVGMLGEHVDQLFHAIPSDGTAFDIQDYFFRLTLDTATEFLFGESTHCLSPQKASATGPLAIAGGEKGFAYAFNASQDGLIHRARAQNFYWLVNPRRFREAVKLVHDVVDYYVDQALAKQNHSEEEKFIGNTESRYVFLEAVARETQDRIALRDQMLNILLAGRDTTASLLSSSFYYLSRHPQVWARLRTEILNIFPATQTADRITIERLREVKYLRYFLNEVLRLIPPVSFNSRWATTDTTLPVGGGPDGKSPIFVPKGQKVNYSVALMHRRRDLWGEDAEDFRPERWEENSKHGWEYLPFNGGPRICLGQQYALAEASYVLVRLLQKFERVENAQPELTQPDLRISLTVAHASVKVRLYAAA